MAAQQMLSQHAEKRDEYGLPILRDRTSVRLLDEAGPDQEAQRVAWNTDHEELILLTEQARNHIEKIRFILTWSMPHLHVPDYPDTRTLAGVFINSFSDKSIREEVDLLNRIIKAASAREEQLARASVVFLDYAVSDVSDRFSPRGPRDYLRLPPQGFLRVWGPASHTEYDGSIGFLCSAWDTCRPAANLEELHQRGILSVPGLQSHCENGKNPSAWVSLSSEPSWILEFINKKWPPTNTSTSSVRIALISTAKMERLRLIFERSDLLVHSAGGTPYSKKHPNGVKFAWHNHYLVYGWIPVQCIVKVFSLAQFRRICEDRSIRPGDIVSIDPYTFLLDSPEASIDAKLQRLGI